MSDQALLRRGTYRKSPGYLDQTGKDQSFETVVENPNQEAAVIGAPEGASEISAAFPYKTRQEHI